MLSRLAGSVASRASTLSRIAGVRLLSTSDQSNTTAPIPTYHYETGTWRETAWPFLSEYKKIAGNTGEYALILGIANYMTSEEMWSLPVGGILSVQALFFYTVYRKAQAPAKAWHVKSVKEQLDKLYSADKVKMISSETAIAEAAVQMRFLEDRPEFFEIKQNQVELEAEVTYRKRLLEVETEIKKRLDYQVEMQNVQRSIEEKHIAAWVEKEVLKSIAEQREEDTFQACINDLEALAAAKAVA